MRNLSITWLCLLTGNLRSQRFNLPIDSRITGHQRDFSGMFPSYLTTTGTNTTQQRII